MFTITPPVKKAEITDQLAILNREIAVYNRKLSTDAFIQPQSTFWSPAEHLRHLIKSVRPVAMALKIPKLFLRFKFGQHRGNSRSFAEIQALYEQQLNEGATAGRFTPGKMQPPDDPERWQNQVIESWQKVGESLIENLQPWSEVQLNRYLLPHPLLGKLTVREMLFFTLYHNKHHACRVDERHRTAT